MGVTGLRNNAPCFCAPSLFPDMLELDHDSAPPSPPPPPLLHCRWLDSVGCHATKILAKVETRQALLNFRGILNEADGIIISRGEGMHTRDTSTSHQACNWNEWFHVAWMTDRFAPC